ncbi:UNVERIFIED_CONTAM: hypothetical protein FKN15_023888 [Acipenser sinensis]
MRLTALLAMAARVKVPPDYRYGTSRPWTVGAQRMNPPGKKRRKVFVEPIQPEEWSLFKGDTDVLEWPLSGFISLFLPEFPLRSFPGKERFQVRRARDLRKPTQVEWRFTEEGERVRVSLRSGRILPKPVVQRRDGIVPEQWKGKLGPPAHRKPCRTHRFHSSS